MAQTLKNPTAFLMTLHKRVAYHRLKKEGGWGWRRGMRMYLNPEIRCPLCDSFVPSNRVFLVDELNQLLPRQWSLKDGEQIPRDGTRLYHPHVTDTKGTLCLRYAKNPAQLLFNSINPGYTPEGFLWSIGHDCPNFVRYKCRKCNKRFPTFTGRAFGHNLLCGQECIDKATIENCISCFKVKAESPEYTREKQGIRCVGCHRTHQDYVERMEAIRQQEIADEANEDDDE